MRNFLKIVFGSCLGVIIAFLVLGFVGSIIVTSLMVSGKSTTDVKANSVLKISFDKRIPEKTGNTEEAMFNLANEPFVGLYETAQLIRQAKEDRNIKGILLYLSGSGMGHAKAQYLRNALLDFKSSGKFIYAYSGNYGYSQGAYYLATASDKVMIHPLGGIDLRGFGTEIPFFKDMLDKIGIEMQVFYAGKYKGASEPFRLNEMSEENRYQIKQYITALYESFVQDIASGRNLLPQDVRKSAENLLGRNAELALENRLVDAIQYEDEVLAQIRSQLDLGEKDKINLVDVAGYYQSKGKDLNLTAPSKIAVLYAEGEIRGGKEQYGMITDEAYVDIIRKIREDEKIKAVVLRVNSPGGDAYVSDEIWRELELVQEKEIPVVVSMGDVAASGGYYIACGADKILAEPNTITGSIGVFGMVPNMEKLFNDKLGIHFDTVRTARYANGLVNPFYPVGAEEAALVQEGVDRTYEVFLSRVAEGRKMSRDQVHEIAQGRVWTGAQAREIGLVDELGNIDDAIRMAAELAGTDDYRITEYPRIKDPVQKLIEDLTGQHLPAEITEKLLAQRFPKSHQLISSLEYMMSQSNPMARLPFDLPFE